MANHVEEKERTRLALLGPKRGTLFSEMLAYWCCVISVEGGKPVCIEGNRRNLRIRKYASAEELEARYRYGSIEGHWIMYHETSESNAERFVAAFLAQQEEKGERRDSAIELFQAVTGEAKENLNNLNMKVLCIDNTNLSLSISVGKWYDVVFAVSPNTYCIISDRGVNQIFSKKFFMTLEDLRNEKIKMIINES